MGAVKTVYMSAIDAVRANEIDRQVDSQWREWVKIYADENHQTPLGNVDDVYDVISDFSLAAKDAQADEQTTFALLDLALAKLAEGSDPYEIQEQINEYAEVYMANGNIKIGSIVIQG